MCENVPKVFRSMLEDNGYPKIGAASNCLGVRNPKDIEPDHNNDVHPGSHGMSVDRSLGDIHYTFLPKRLRDLALQKYGKSAPTHIVQSLNSACGSNSRYIWSRGNGLYASCAFARGLHLQVSQGGHGLVAPDSSMPLAHYEQHLYNTQTSWQIDEVI